jgi:hypothetical protein
MIGDATEYRKAQEEIRALEERLERLQQTHPIGSKGFTKAGIRKLIASLHEELAVYEGSEKAKQSESKCVGEMDAPTDADDPVVTTDPKTGLPLIECRRAANPDEEMTPERVAEILLAQEVGWFHEAGGD